MSVERKRIDHQRIAEQIRELTPMAQAVRAAMRPVRPALHENLGATPRARTPASTLAPTWGGL